VCCPFWITGVLHSIISSSNHPIECLVQLSVCCTVKGVKH
jgi:hypothetical protein